MFKWFLLLSTYNNIITCLCVDEDEQPAAAIWLDWKLWAAINTRDRMPMSPQISTYNYVSTPQPVLANLVDNDD